MESTIRVTLVGSMDAETGEEEDDIEEAEELARALRPLG
jgi:hypothetical protein